MHYECKMVSFNSKTHDLSLFKLLINNDLKFIFKNKPILIW